MISSLTNTSLYALDRVNHQLATVKVKDVERSLAKPKLDEWDLLNLLSPVAETCLEKMAQKAQQVTRKRFGNIMKLYAPIYLSNVCFNRCVYCGFNVQHDIRRRTLLLDEVEEQGRYLAEKGFKNLLLVSGESKHDVPLDYLSACIKRLKPYFTEISIEIYPLEEEGYRYLADQGLYGMVLYQETYLKQVYEKMHLGGKKKDYDYRLHTPERAAQANLRQVGLGVLLGLTDFRIDAFYLGLHAMQLEKKYWKTAFGLSFPRITKATGNFKPPCPVSDKNFVQMVTALRLFLPDAPFSLSTREPKTLRNHLLPLGFTQMSAGSCTEPGGYGKPSLNNEQFQVEDTRSVSEIAEELRQLGLEPVWKDWDGGFTSQE